MPLQSYSDQFPILVNGLLNLKINGRQAHGWMFSGDDLPLLNDFCKHWLQGLICQNTTDVGDSCGVCNHCRAITEESYPHFYKLCPTSKSRRILIDEVREFERHLYLKTAGAKKIGFIFEADRMDAEAQNAVLKTLEEPTDDTVIVLITTNSHTLLPTIRSRCQTVNLCGNQIRYDFDGFTDLCEILPLMTPGAGALVGARVHGRLMDITDRLQTSSEDAENASPVEPKYQHSVDDPEVRKKVEALAAARKHARYLANREKLISAIYIWFAQEFLRVQGVPPASLPHPEFYGNLIDQLPRNSPSHDVASRNLRLADKFLRDLNYNVDERLAIHNLCQTICLK